MIAVRDSRDQLGDGLGSVSTVAEGAFEVIRSLFGSAGPREPGYNPTAQILFPPETLGCTRGYEIVSKAVPRHFQEPEGDFEQESFETNSGCEGDGSIGDIKKRIERYILYNSYA